jgi:hypothetical protein
MAKPVNLKLPAGSLAESSRAANPVDSREGA